MPLSVFSAYFATVLSLALSVAKWLVEGLSAVNSLALYTFFSASCIPFALPDVKMDAKIRKHQARLFVELLAQRENLRDDCHFTLWR
ncbi:MAG: hypothetical protein D6803_05155 [Anaerolineae bacterium]|nr:MAG: hypothetical protein D6803_05155 [Anaerolineae bacterium]